MRVFFFFFEMSDEMSRKGGEMKRTKAVRKALCKSPENNDSVYP